MADSSADKKERLEAQAERRRRGLLVEFAQFLGHTKKWWLAPILIVLLLLAVLLIFGATAAGPFIYPLF